MSAPKAFILHLERAAARRVTVEKLRAALPIDSEVLPAVDGASLSSETVEGLYRPVRFRPRYPFALRPPEIGAFLSHRSAWRRILDLGLDFGVVFEDDAAIDPEQFSGLLEFLSRRRDGWDYALTPALGLEPKGVALVRAGGFALLKPRAPPLRAIGQFVSRAAAERLLAVTETFDRPVDTFLQMSWITGVPLLTAGPTPIRDVSGETGGTTIQRRRTPLMDRVHREVLRPIYRASILARHRVEVSRPDWQPTIAPRIPLESK